MEKIFKYSSRISFFPALILTLATIAFVYMTAHYIFGRDIPDGFIPWLIAGVMIGWLVIIWISVFYFSSVIINNEVVARRLYNYTIWQTPINAITDIGDGPPASTRGSTGDPMGLIIKTKTGHLYRIPNDLQNTNDFLNVLKEINPNIIYHKSEMSPNPTFQNVGSFLVPSNSVLDEYNKIGLQPRVIAICIFLVAAIMLYFAISKTIAGGGINFHNALNIFNLY